MKKIVSITFVAAGLFSIVACSKADTCTCKTTVTATGQQDIVTSTTRELEDGETCELSVSNGSAGNMQTVVCTLD